MEKVLAYKSKTVTGSISATEMDWVRSNLDQVSVEIEINHLVDMINKWIDLTKYFGHLQVIMVKEGLSPDDIDIFERLCTTLLACGSSITRVVRQIDDEHKQLLMRVGHNQAKIDRVYENIKDSYQEWYAESSETDRQELEKIFA